MRILATTLVLACLFAPATAQAQGMRQKPAPTLRALPVVLAPTFTPLATSTGRRTRAREGAVIGFAVGVTATILLTRSGGSTSLCNSDANQDAMNSGECFGLAVAGGLVGAGVGALIGSRVRISALHALPSSQHAQEHRSSRLVIAAISFVVPPH